MRRRIAILAGMGVVIIGGVLTALYQAPAWKAGLKRALAGALVKQVLAPAGFSQDRSNAPGRAIYVMGGDRDSLRVRFAKTAELYKQGIARKVLIKRDDMLMAHSPDLGRNPTYDEWSRTMLSGFGVEGQDIEVVAVEDGFLGTFQEAKALSVIVSRLGISSLVLVSSDYHTARVWYIFSKLLRHKNVNLYIYPAEEAHGGYMLLREYIKFACYRIFL